MLPSNLGQINYKASLLHLQPRQMRLEITDLKDDDEDDLEAGDVWKPDSRSGLEGFEVDFDHWYWGVFL